MSEVPPIGSNKTTFKSLKVGEYEQLESPTFRSSNDEDNKIYKTSTQIIRRRVDKGYIYEYYYRNSDAYTLSHVVFCPIKLGLHGF